MNVEHKSFPNYGYSIAMLPSDILIKIKEEVEHIEQEIEIQPRIERGLAGHLEHQFYLDRCQTLIKPFVLEMANEYMLAWNYESEILRKYTELKTIFFKLEPIWVNFQKKTEYNPLHDHTGIFSFVIWVNIPYDLKTEMEMPCVASSNSPLATTFNFVYTNVFGEIAMLPFFAESKYEGTILFFPSQLKHLVYPFLSSDKHRITISGNITVDATM